MKVFVTSDIHGRLDYIKKITEFLKCRKDIDCFIICGDFTADYVTRSFTELENRQYDNYKNLKEILSTSNKDIIFILGNHDTFTVDKSDTVYLPYNDKELYNNFVPLEYTNFYMYGLKREGDEEDMKRRLSKLRINSESIIVSHIPPYKCLDKSVNGIHYGSTAILDMIKSKTPAFFFCGHVHNAFGFKKLHKTMVFNVACDDTTARGWIVDTVTLKYEKIIL